MRNIRLYLFAFVLLVFQCQAYAFGWNDLWWRADEQGKKLLDKGQAKQAAEKFEDNNWKATAYYRAGQYAKAVEQYAEDDSAQAHYNRGNALAHLGQYESAIAAYDEALKMDKQLEDAKFNRDILKKLLKQQKSQSNNDQQQKKSQQNQNNQANQKQQNHSQQKPNQQSNQQQQNSANKDKQKEHDAPDKKASKEQEKAQRQAAKQWLRRIPDNPGGLLRQKFLRDYLRMQRE